MNRQLRHEALPLFYSTNIFSVDISFKGRENTGRWLEAIRDANASHLRRLALSTRTLSRARPSGGWDTFLVIGEVDMKTCEIRLEAYVNSSPHIVQAVTKREDVERLKEAEEAFRSIFSERGLLGLGLAAARISVVMKEFDDFCGSSDNPLLRT